MNKKNVRLVCKAVHYYSKNDKAAFFTWISRIPSITKIEQVGDDLHLYLKDKKNPEEDECEIVALFRRYTIDVKQLDAVFDEPYYGSHHNVWPQDKNVTDEELRNRKNTLVCKHVIYYSPIDEDIFFEWLRRIPSVAEIKGIGDELFIHMKDSKIPEEDLVELIALFYSYDVKDMKQLRMFLNDENKAWFADDKEMYWHKRIFGSQ